MLTPAYLTGVSSDVVSIFSEVEQEVAADMAGRIVRMGQVSFTTQWQADRLKQFGLFNDDVTKLMSEATGISKRKINKLMAQAGVESLKYDDAIYSAAGLSPTALANSPALQAVLLQGASSTMGLLSNFTKTTANASNLAFQRLLDKAYIQIMSGAYAPNKAIRLAINELASQGIEHIAYPSGSMDSIESSVRRAVTTGVNQSISKLQIARAKEMECELVETSSHSGARPTHEVWQGQIFSLSRDSGRYPDFYDSTGYGDGDGLCGWNCYHSFFPYFDGLSTRSFSEDPAGDYGRSNTEEYELQQKQRYYERQVRDAKKKCTVLDAAAESSTSQEEYAEYKKDFQNASVLLKGREQALDNFLDKTGRRRDKDREQVGGFTRSISSKAVWANRKARK